MKHQTDRGEQKNVNLCYKKNRPVTGKTCLFPPIMFTFVILEWNFSN